MSFGDEINRKIELLRQFEQNVNDEIKTVINQNSTKLTDQILNQLWDGVDGEGDDIRPYYTEDRFFPTAKVAMRYAEWKNTLTPNPRRNVYAPNLYINGYFYSTLYVEVGEDQLEIKSMNGFGDDVMAKYGKDTFSVSPIFIEDEVLPQVKEKLINRLRDDINK